MDIYYIHAQYIYHYAPGLHDASVAIFDKIHYILMVYLHNNIIIIIYTIVITQ